MKRTLETLLGLASAVLLATAIHTKNAQAVSTPLPLVAFGSEANSQACGGIQISSHHVLVHSTCVANESPLTIAHVLELPEAPSSNVTEVATMQATLRASMSVANSTTILFDQLPNNASSSVRSVIVVALNEPLPPNISYPVTLPLRTPYPIYLTADQNALLMSIDMATLHVTSIPGVIFVDDSSCAHSVCALPLAVNERVAHTEPHQWSFLLTRDKEDRAYRLLGVGGDPVTDHNGIWGFEWLPQALTTSSLMSRDTYGVKTVLSVNKEIYNGKNVKTTSEFTEFIAGLRTVKNGPMLCGGALIASKWVLTSAGCTKYRPTVVVIDTLPSRGEPTEVFKIKQTIPHPSYRPTGHSHNFMLVQLDRPSSRRPIKYNQNKDNTPVSAMATAFGYGATSYRSKEMNDRLRSMKVEVLGAPYCPEKLSPWLDATTMCVKKQLCYGDYGGPVITDAWSDQRVLFGIISNDFYCRNKHDSNIVGRVSAVAEWINSLLK